jgi:hypothetical protein
MNTGNTTKKQPAAAPKRRDARAARLAAPFEKRLACGPRREARRAVRLCVPKRQ